MMYRGLTWTSDYLRPPITGGHRYDAEVLDRLKVLGVAVDEFVTDEIKKPNPFSIALKLFQRVSQNRHRLLFIDSGAHNKLLLAVLLHKLRGGKVAAIVHHLSHPLKKTALRQTLDKWLSILFLHLCDFIVVNSLNTKKAVLQLGIPDSTCIVIYPALGVEPLTKNISKIPKKPYRLLYVGYFEHRKGFDILLQALAHLEPGYCCLTAVGDESIDPLYARQMHSIGEELGLSIVYKGRITPRELSILYQQHDLLVCPARHEGFGMTLIEAQAHGLPVVAFEVGAIPEVVTYEKGGLLVPAFDTKAFASAIIRLMEDNSFWQEQSNLAILKSKKYVGWERLGDEIYAHFLKRNLL